MPNDLADLLTAAQWADAQALIAYDAYLRAPDHQALQQAAVHAHEAVNARMRADATPAAAALQLIEHELPGVCAVIHAAADKLASDTASRLRAVWELLQLHGPSPALLCMPRRQPGSVISRGARLKPLHAEFNRSRRGT